MIVAAGAPPSFDGVVHSGKNSATPLGELGAGAGAIRNQISEQLSKRELQGFLSVLCEGDIIGLNLCLTAYEWLRLA
jgi:hypothetical protein